MPRISWQTLPIFSTLAARSPSSDLSQTFTVSHEFTPHFPPSVGSVP